MSFLTEFVSTLSSDERKRLRSIPVRGKQADILNAVLLSPDDEDYIRSEAKRLKMSLSHLHSTQSMLLGRCYEALVPEGGTDLLTFLRVRSLDGHFRRELHNQEQKIHQHNVTKEQRHEFYLRLINLLVGTTSSRFDKKFFSSAVRMYHRSIITPHPDDGLHVHICDALAETIALFANPSRTDPTRRRGALLKRLNDLKQKLGSSDHYLALYHLEYAFALYYAILEHDAKLSERYVNSLAEIVRLLPETIRRDEYPKVQLRKAGIKYLSGNFDEALKLYLGQYRSHGADLFRQYGFHRDRFVRCALAERDLPLVERLLNDAYAPNLNNKQSTTATAALMHRTALHLLRGDFHSARKTLKDAYKMNKGNTFVFGLDVHLRFMEIILEFAAGADAAYTSLLIGRSIKYLNRKGMTLKSGGDVILFYALKDLCAGKKHSEFAAEVYREGYPAYPVFLYFLKSIGKTKARRLHRAS